MNRDGIYDMIKQLLFSKKLVLVANTIPLFQLTQLVIIDETNEKEADILEVIANLFKLIEDNIEYSKDP